MRSFFSAALFAALLPFAAISTLGNSLPPISELPSPAAPDTQCPNLTAAPDGTLHLLYAGPAPAGSPTGARTLYLSSLAPTATAFSAPRPVVTTPALMENWADFASLAVGTDGALTAQWFQKITGSTERHGYDGWFARSTDGGASWTTPAPLGHEFVALAPLSAGRTLAVWLESTRTHGAHSVSHQQPAGETPKSSAPSMKLMARLFAPDGASLGEWTVDPDVCTCCQNTVAVLPGDRVFVAYRGHTPDEIRDSKFKTFDLVTRTWSPAATLRDDRWKIPACPVNGPAADSRDAAVAVAWFTAAEGVARVQARISADAASTFSVPVTVDLGRPLGRLETVMLADHSAVLLWMEMKSGQNAAGIYARRLFPDGTLSAPRLITDTTQARASGFPRAALRPSGRIVLAWTQPGEPSQVRTLEFDPTPLIRASALSFVPTPFRSVPLELCTTPLASLH